MQASIEWESLIAPCGMNCALCLAYSRKRNKCEGCWGDNQSKPWHCVACSIKNCGLLAESGSKFCYDCTKFPCSRIKQLDKRYRTKYGMSMIENLRNIMQMGLSIFVENEQVRWACPQCGKTICVHNGICTGCNQKFETKRP